MSGELVDWWTEDCELVTEDCGQRFLIALSLARNFKLLDTKKTAYFLWRLENKKVVKRG